MECTFDPRGHGAKARLCPPYGSAMWMQQTGRGRMKSFVVGRVGELAEGERRVISCDGTEVGVFNVDGELVAWYNQCAHRGGPVCQGRIYQRVLEPVDEHGETRMLQHDPTHKHIVCPWHGWEFDLKTGRHPGGDRFALRKAKLEIADGHVYVVV
jgi:nitrite reductase (NADH) small subunit